MSSLSPKLALFAQFAAVAKSLAHAHRLELLEQLAQGERSVEVLAERTGLSVANGRLDGGPWPDGSTAALEIFDARGGMAARALMTVGDRDQGTRMSLRREARVYGVVIYAGVAPYFAYSVLYDTRRQMIGLKPRTPRQLAAGPHADDAAAPPAP